MTGQFYEPQARDLIACDDGVHYVLLDRASDFCNWVMRRHPDGPLVSVRKATDHELAHAKARQHLRAGVAMLQGDAPEQRTPAPACHPDDQDEIYRIHRAFIALDEPNNEQVMAFQDASYALGLKRGQAHEAALQQRLTEADQRIDELMRDKHRLDALGDNFWDVRHHSTALADTGDCTSGVDIIGHWMEKPHERVIGENYNENLRAAIDQAMAADAYPPARPEYPELDAALDQLAEDSTEVES